MDTTEYIPQQVSQAIRQIDPKAEVILFGSRARGDALPDSDWDFLVLTSQEVTRPLKKEIRDALWEIEVAQEAVISSLIVASAAWKETTEWPIHQNIDREGIIL